MAEYTLAGGIEAKQRLAVLARICRRTSRALLKRAGIKEGATCLDVGCGGGEVTIDMAHLVGPLGRATGVDFDGAIVSLAREDAAAQGIRNVDFRQGRAENLEEMGYDLVYSRFLLTHLADPSKALRAMVNAVNVDGVVIVEDVEFSATFGYPPSAAFESYVKWTCETLRRRGTDPNIGPRLPALLRAAGLSRVSLDLVQIPITVMEEKRIHDMSMQQIRAATLAEHVATSNEFDEAHAAVRAFADDPNSVVTTPRIWQVWGYRGAA